MNLQAGGLLLVIGISLLSLFFLQTKKNEFDNAVYTLYRQSARYALAADQDEEEIIRVLHANYATGYLWAIKDIVTGEDFKRITGEDLLNFEHKIVSIQDKSTLLLVQKCKDLIPKQDMAILKAVYAKA
jgi:hypothetical protein